MSTLLAIDGVSQAASKLLGELGIDGAEALAAADIESLYRRLTEANAELGAYKKLPDRSTVAQWIDSARTRVGSNGTDDAAGREVPGETLPPLEEIPAARDYFDAEGRRLDIRSVSRSGAPADAEGRHAARKPLDLARIHTFDDVQEGRTAVAPLDRETRSQVTPLAPPIQAKKLERLEADGGSGISRWVMRGIQYPQPVKLYIGMVIVFLSRLLFLAVSIGTPIAIFQRWRTGEDYVLAFVPVIVAFLVVGLLHLVVAARFRCKVCSCHLLFARRCHKNDKAHRVFPLGWVGSAALHGIIFRWLRCMYCGTPTQLKAKPKK